MAAEDVEIVRRIHSAWFAGNAREALDLLDPEIVWENPPDAVEPGTRRGIEDFRVALAMVADTFDSPVFEIEEVLDTSEQVVVIGVLRGQGHSSRVSIERRQGYVWTIRDGKAVRFAWFNDPASALAAAGLEPDAVG